MSWLKFFSLLGHGLQHTQDASHRHIALHTYLGMQGCAGNVPWCSQALMAGMLQVFRCIVEGCNKRFTTPVERRQHLADFHRFPRGFHYDSIHLGPRAHTGICCRPQPAPKSGTGDTSTSEAQSSEAEQGAADAGKAASACMEVDGLIGSMSKLSSCDSEVPRLATFGRRNRHRAFS